MLRALSSGSTGMIAQQLNLDVIANNVANASTTGYKKVRAEFEDLVSDKMKVAGAQVAQGTYQPIGIEIGLGTKTSGTNRIFEQGTMEPTGGDYDMAIEGDGFFQVQLDDGTLAYTRAGNFKIDGNGQLVTNNGYMVQPQINIPPTASDISISSDGKVSVKAANETSYTEVGTLELAKFLNPSGLTSIGKSLYTETPASGTPNLSTPGQDGMGTINQGYLEGSNVQIVEEMVNLIQAERAFESNSKIITGASDMLQKVTQLR
jgi:flagellar basal-body rod protein FlgG